MNDMSLLKLVLLIIGLVLVIDVVFIGMLALQGDRPIPGVLENVALVGFTALIGLLVPTRSNNNAT